MINTKIVEARNVEGRIEEIELGFCQLPEVPVEKRPPTQLPGQPPVQPMVIKIGGEPFWVIGHTWDLRLARQVGETFDSTLVLVVQRIPPMPSGLVRADASALSQLETMMPPPGGRGN